VYSPNYNVLQNISEQASVTAILARNDINFTQISSTPNERITISNLLNYLYTIETLFLKMT